MATQKNKSILDTHNVVTAQELSRILNMQLDEMERNPECVNVMAPLLIHGSPGCGKSTIVRTVCEDRGIEFIDCRLTQIEPCDIKGLPVPNREGHAARAIDGIRRALTEYTDDAFDYRPSDIGKLLEACEVAANLLECCDLVPMATPPTATILAWRRLVEAGQKPVLGEVRAFAYNLAKTLRELCQIL